LGGLWWYFDGASFMAGLEGNAVTVAIQADVRARHRFVSTYGAASYLLNQDDRVALELYMPPIHTKARPKPSLWKQVVHNRWEARRSLRSSFAIDMTHDKTRLIESLLKCAWPPIEISPQTELVEASCELGQSLAQRSRVSI
jgi:hypothetical protein